MCRHDRVHDPILCALPPYILDCIVAKGKASQRRAAQHTRNLTNTMRIARLTGTASRLPRIGEADDDDSGDLRNRRKGRRRRILDARGREMDVGRVARLEGQDQTGDAAVDEAYDGLGATYDFFHGLFGREGIEGRDKELLGVVHYGKKYDNAFWDGDSMQFGDGDGELFNRFTISLDVIGHELSHGVTQWSSFGGLPYYCSGRPDGANPGAINESVSDCFGAAIRQRVLGLRPTDLDGWLIGKGLLAATVHGRALRDMAAPGTAYDDPVLGTDPQPADLSRYVVTRNDSGGVHVNSGIPNRAFYLSAVALDGLNLTSGNGDRAPVGDGTTVAAAILYGVLTRGDDIPQDCTFAQWAAASVRVAQELYGTDARAAVADAWAQTGIAVPTA